MWLYEYGVLTPKDIVTFSRQVRGNRWVACGRSVRAATGSFSNVRFNWWYHGNDVCDILRHASAVLRSWYARSRGVLGHAHLLDAVSLRLSTTNGNI